MPSINFNPAGVIAEQNFTMSQTRLSVTQSQIATGLRVQTATDDPASLAVSQRLKAKIGGLGVGVDNSKAADKLLATADKALGNMQDILQNMRQLSVKASNDAVTSTDRKNYQKQLNDYRKELDRIANSTKYKERNLLQGDMARAKAASTDDGKGEILSNVAVNEQSTMSTPTNLINATTGVTGTNTATQDVTVQFKITGTGTVQYARSDTATIDPSTGDINNWADVGGATLTVNSAVITLATAFKEEDIGKTAVVHIKSKFGAVTSDKSLSFQTGGDAGDEIAVGISKVTSDALNISALDITNSLTAKNSVSALDRAINFISDERANVGSTQNRLQVSISNAETYKANLQGSLAQEQDVDYASAVLSLTTDQVKQQASLAMLTQANQSQQAVLGLLR